MLVYRWETQSNIHHFQEEDEEEEEAVKAEGDSRKESTLINSQVHAHLS